MAVPDPTGGGDPVEEAGGGVVELDLTVVLDARVEEATVEELEPPPDPGRHCE